MKTFLPNAFAFVCLAQVQEFACKQRLMGNVCCHLNILEPCIAYVLFLDQAILHRVKSIIVIVKKKKKKGTRNVATLSRSVEAKASHGSVFLETI